MRHRKLNETGDRGWFIGSFSEAIIETDLVEVCYTTEKAGSGKPHYHTLCTETVLIISGSAEYKEKIYSSGDILVFEKGEVNSMQYLETTTMIGVKIPAGGNDKVIV